MTTSIEQSFSVPFAYPLHFTRDVFDAGNPLFRKLLTRSGETGPHRILPFVDSGVLAAWPSLPECLARYAEAHADVLTLAAPPAPAQGGEAIKNDYRFTMEIVDRILEHQLCRHSFILIIGGGAVLDAVGFAAGIVHRGMRVIRMPTTVLAQNDAGVGVKTGMNLHGGKNTIGTFQPPWAVVDDLQFLETLPDREWRAGIAEAVKVALIKDAAFFDRLEASAPALRRRDPQAMEDLVRRCAELHLEHIRTSGDPFEMGRARPLDFGHWAAHKLESLSDYRVGHGQAVAAGIALDTLYAEACGWLPPQDAMRILRALQQCGLPLWYEDMDRRLGDGEPILLQGLDDFREHLGGTLCVTFPDGIGRAREEQTIDRDLMRRCLSALQAAAGAPAAGRSGPS